ncbi:hypothetical protein G9C98_007350 [Cotesia typhae]|uniref:Uncharacterized protein n=1 Tax=Cotesia typhae TaxID=2053667 RepID=A0A8J5VAC3_9HYME|nr:hypothetical protein G9C98_007350 [Cotesia typhae]
MNKEWENESEHRNVFRSRVNTSIDIAFEGIDARKIAVITQTTSNSSNTMSRPILSRPRTRVYDCNYDKGESYYKPMMDHLDRKYSARPLFPESRGSFADEIAARRSDIGNIFSRFPKWF